MNKLTKMSTVLLASGIILVGCGGNKELAEKKDNKVFVLYNSKRYWRYESTCLWWLNVCRKHDI
mgnify:CR=1 FL=1